MDIICFFGKKYGCMSCNYLETVLLYDILCNNELLCVF